VIGASLPGGLTLYWVAINVVSIVQQYLVFRKK
jgi:membrane protein insertase Oxa1/YidC/SpoIIIJ